MLQYSHGTMLDGGNEPKLKEGITRCGNRVEYCTVVLLEHFRDQEGLHDFASMGNLASSI